VEVGDEAKPMRGSPEHERRHDNDVDRQRLKLGVSTEESERELGNEGKRWGCSRGGGGGAHLL
jgi:hypothetical protein